MDIPKDATRAYKTHRCGAMSRAIAFHLTIEQWWALWEPYWDDRVAFRLQMCRTKDQGGYELGNVRIDMQAGNAADRSPESYQRSNRALTLLPGTTLGARVNRLEVRALRRALSITGNNASAAARLLGITYRQFRHSMMKHKRLAMLNEAASLADVERRSATWPVRK